MALTSKTGSLGTLSAANTTFTSLSGTTVTQMALYKDTGSATTSPLLVLYDTATGLPLLPNGGNVVVAWSSGQLFTLFQGLKENERDSRLIAQLREWKRWLRGSAPKSGQMWFPEPKIILG